MNSVVIQGYRQLPEVYLKLPPINLLNIGEVWALMAMRFTTSKPRDDSTHA